MIKERDRSVSLHPQVREGRGKEGMRWSASFLAAIGKVNSKNAACRQTYRKTAPKSRQEKEWPHRKKTGGRGKRKTIPVGLDSRKGSGLASEGIKRKKGNAHRSDSGSGRGEICTSSLNGISRKGGERKKYLPRVLRRERKKKKEEV